MAIHRQNKLLGRNQKLKNYQIFMHLKTSKRKGQSWKRSIIIKKKIHGNSLFDKSAIVGKKLKKSVNSNQLLKHSNLKKIEIKKFTGNNY